MVQSKDLMVGNYLKYNGMPYRVIQVDGIVGDGWILENGEEDCGEPIPIDIPMLQNNGFTWDGMYARYTKGTMQLEYYKHEGIIREWYLHKDGSKELIASSRPGFRYIHSFQNWLTVNGIDKGIKLLYNELIEIKRSQR